MKEKDLHTIVKTHLVQDLEKVADTYSRWDSTSDKYQYYIELKCRHTHYATLMLEEKKYRALMEGASKLGYKPVYICSTPKGIYIWRLDLMEEPKWETRMMPKTSEFGWQADNKVKVPKPCFMLDTRTADRAFHLPSPADKQLKDIVRFP